MQRRSSDAASLYARRYRVGARIAGVAVLASTVGLAATTMGATAATQSVKAHAAKQYTIGLSSEGLSTEFVQKMADGVQAEAKKEGVKAIVLDGKDDPATQANTIQDLLSENVNGIIIDPVSAGPAGNMVKEIDKAGKPVVLMHGQAGSNPSPTYVDPGVAAEVNENEVNSGALAGQLALKAVKSGSQVGIVTGLTGMLEVAQREQGFESAIKGKLKVVGVGDGDWTPTGGQQVCQGLLQAHPKIALIYSESDGMDAGCLNAIKAAGSKAKMVSIGGELAAKKDIQAGKVYGTVCFEPYTEGQEAMQALYAVLTHKSTKSRVLDSFHTPVVTKSNLNDCAWQWS